MNQATTERPKKRALSFCRRPVELPVEQLLLPKRNISVNITANIDEISDVWDGMVPNEEFAQSRYLKTLEITNPAHLTNLYLVLRDINGSVIGVVLLQSLVLDLSESFNYENYTTDHSYWSGKWQRFRQWAVSAFKFRMLTVGNLYLTGEYGMFISNISTNENFNLLADIISMLRKELCATPYRFSGVLYKDFFEKEENLISKSLGLTQFKIDPNMILPLRDTWQTFDDYLAAMRSKYRIRLKSGIRKFKDIKRRELNYDQLCQYNKQIYTLYNDILDGSGFVLARGDDQYFKILKEQLGDQLHVIGYFLDDELVGFYTWVLEGDKMDSHFIGINSAINLRHQLYLNILLDLVKDSIEQRAKSLYLFRTALEIKSSVGAEPHDMLCYFKHMNPIINKLIIPPAFKYFVPEQTWVQRHPFKV